MFVPLRPTLCDANSSRLHDCIIMHFGFIQIYCSKHQRSQEKKETKQSRLDRRLAVLAVNSAV